MCFISVFNLFLRPLGFKLVLLSSAIYTSGVDSTTKEAIRELTHFSLGTHPFEYLGIPLSSKRISIVECACLADKMTSRIKGWQVKHLSYAARLQLINSVVMRISSYWCQILILSKKIIQY